jgi:hypothetical protein
MYLTAGAPMHVRAPTFFAIVRHCSWGVSVDQVVQVFPIGTRWYPKKHLEQVKAIFGPDDTIFGIIWSSPASLMPLLQVAWDKEEKLKAALANSIVASSSRVFPYMQLL